MKKFFIGILVGALALICLAASITTYDQMMVSTLTSSGPVTNRGRYYVLGEGANPSPSVILGITRGIQFTDLASNPTNVEFRSFTSTVASTNSGQNFWIGDGANKVALSNGVNGVNFIDARGALTNVTGQNAVFTGSGSFSQVIVSGSGGVQFGPTYAFFTASTTFHNRSDVVVTLSNFAENDFGRLQLGGTTASFPSIKRVSADLEARLADDSASANIRARTLLVTSGSNLKAGTFTLVAGAATVSNTSVTANSVIVVTLKTVGGTRAGNPDIVPTASTGFVATGVGTDTSTYNYIILEVN